MSVSEYTVPTAILTDIADAIRAKTGQTGLITPEQMAGQIAAIPSGGGGATVEALSVMQNGVYTAPENVAYSPVTVAVPIGFDYDLKEVTVSSNTPTVDRAFDNFLFIAQIQKTSMPAAADRVRLNAYYLMFAYVNGHYIPTGTGGNAANGFSVVTNTAGAEVLIGTKVGMSRTSVGETSITFSTYTDQNMQTGKWNALQIELPSASPIYSFYDL